MKPLAGIRVIDMTTNISGPTLTMILADLGAEVIKVERPGSGDAIRHLIPGVFEAVNKGKKSIALDLKNAEDIAFVKQLVAEVDIVIEGFRPGVMARLGLDYDQLKAINPTLIYGAISGYGPNSRTLLASPLMAAAAAVHGKIVDVNQN